MSQQLGKIQKPDAERFRQGKKLYLVPLLYCPQDAPKEYEEKYSRYWRQAREQLNNLASKIGQVNRVYHESILQGGEGGIKAIERLNPSSYQIARSRCDGGAVFEVIEEKELLEEVMDWQRCLMLGFISEKVERTVLESYLEAGKRRNESIAQRITDTLKDDEAGILFIREGHLVQFPADVEVFSVFPPALDEIHRWQRDQARMGAEEPVPEGGRKTEPEAAKVQKKVRKKAKRKPED
jgi:hypothetical protein